MASVYYRSAAIIILQNPEVKEMTNDVAANCEEPAEYVSMKFLLKQVYAAHSTKVKELESEIVKLRQELKNSQNTVRECQKCKEMESAYSACKEEYKNAVLEQTRRLQELELKFSTIERKEKSPPSPETDKPNILHETRPCIAFDTLSQSFTLPDSEIEPRVKISKPLHYFTSTAVALDSIENISESPPKFSKLDSKKKNHISDVAVITKDFLSAKKSNCSLIDDDAVLVPDTVELSHSPMKSNHETPKANINIGKENKDIEIEESSSSKKRAFSDGTSNAVKPNRPSRMSEEICAKASSLSMDPLPTSVPNTKRKKLEKARTGWSNNFKDLVCSSTSLSTNNDEQLIKKNNSIILSDDDFQSSNITEESRLAGWKVSGKKGLQKKQLSIKGIKVSSRFKMTLEAPPENFKKPNYKQTKLSKSIFQSHKKSTEDVLSDHGRQNKDEVHEIDAPGCPEVNSPHNETSVAGLSELASLADEDFSRVPDSLLLMGVKTENLSKYSEASSPLEFCAEEDKENNDHDVHVFLDDVQPIDEDNELENYDSFDRLPVIEEPNYKYKEDAVRNKAKRKQLNGFECKECENYYEQLGLSEEEKKERLKQCSRHRAKYVPPATPEHFWELDFPDTEECKARGYQAETQKVQLKTRRRRPL